MDQNNQYLAGFNDGYKKGHKDGSSGIDPKALEKAKTQSFNQGKKIGYDGGYQDGQIEIEAITCLTYFSLSDNVNDRLFVVTHPESSETLLHQLLEDSEINVRLEAIKRVTFSHSKLIQLASLYDELDFTVSSLVHQGKLSEAVSAAIDNVCHSFDPDTALALAGNRSICADALCPLTFWSDIDNGFGRIRGPGFDVRDICESHPSYDKKKYIDFLINKSGTDDLLERERIFTDPQCPQELIESNPNDFAAMLGAIIKTSLTEDSLKALFKRFYSKLKDCDISNEEMFHATYTRDKLNRIHDYEYSSEMFPIVQDIHEALSNSAVAGIPSVYMSDYWVDFFDVTC